VTVDDLARSVVFISTWSMLPSFLLGLFPFWMALRRGRPAVGLAALVTCTALGLLAVIATGQPTYDAFTLVLIGAFAGLAGAIGWSLLLRRRAT
jgi:hypothetical protein